jgi:hypothetical protein
VVHDVVTDPEESRAYKSHYVALNFGHKAISAGATSTFGALGGEVRDVKFQDQKSHHDSEYAIT